MAFAPPQILFDEITDFLSSAPSIDEIVAFQPSERLNQRLHELLDKNTENTLSSDERQELEEFMRMNHLLKMIRIKSRLKQMGKA
jgi:hypothetical protein